MTLHVLCLNPALDKLYVIDRFAAGEVYTGQSPRVCAGGKGVNVARVLSQLGAFPRVYAFMGETGAEPIRREMQDRCDCSFIAVPGACRTTVNIVDRALGQETVISEAGPRVTHAHVESLLRALRENVRAGDIVCCSGSVIAGAPKDIYAQVSRLCGKVGALCALDCNASALGPSLDGAHYALGKPNERELAALLGETPPHDAREAARMARRMMPPYGALLVSMGPAGGVYVTRDGALAAVVPHLEVVSTVGCGDASFAGALLAFAHGMDAKQTLRLAMACGAACAVNSNPGSVDKATVDRLLGQIDVQAI